MFVKIKVVMTAVLMLVAAAAYAGNCQIDGSMGYFTGKTKVISGTLLKVYRCPQGHEWYER